MSAAEQLHVEVVRFSESPLLEVSIQFSKCLTRTSAIEGLLCYVCMKGVCLVISPRNASGSREKKRSRHGPRCGHTPLDIVS